MPIGAEHSLSTGAKPCGLWVDAERARFVRRPIAEILNSADEWEPKPKIGNVSLGQLFLRENDAWVRALAVPRMLDGRGFGNLCKLREKGIYANEGPQTTSETAFFNTSCRACSYMFGWRQCLVAGTGRPWRSEE